MVTEDHRKGEEQLSPWTPRTLAEALLTKRISVPAGMRAFRPERLLPRESPRELGATLAGRLASWTSSCNSSNGAPSLSLSQASEFHNSYSYLC